MTARALAIPLCSLAALLACARLGYEELPLGVTQGGGGNDSGGAGSSAMAGEAGDLGGTGIVQGGSGMLGGAAGSVGGMAPTAGAAGDGGESGGTGGGETSGPTLPCTDPFTWQTDFSTDPTQQDLNGDAMPDFAWLAGGSFDPQQLVNGVWHAGIGVNLATSPRSEFLGTSYVRVVMRDAGSPRTPDTAGFNGALAWINVDYAGDELAPLWMRVVRKDATTQHVDFWNKLPNGTQVLANGPLERPADAFVTLEMVIEPQQKMVSHWLDGVLIGAVSYQRHILPGNNDKYANLHTPTGPAEYDEFVVKQCAP